MIDLKPLKQLGNLAATGLPLAVMGLGKSGLAAARAIQAADIPLMAWDDSVPAREAAEAEGLPLYDLAHADFARVAALVLAPGIPHTHPAPHLVAARAKASRVPIIGDVELLYRAEPTARYIGITGTNGKSTTTALVGHILDEAGLDPRVGGNLGPPALGFEPGGVGRWTVIEMSSYQIELTPSLPFQIAAHLNISPDHLDRHGGMAGYVAAKARLFEAQEQGATAVVGIDDAPSAWIADEIEKRGDSTVWRVSVNAPVFNGTHVTDGILTDMLDQPDSLGFRLNLTPFLHLPGTHNWQNAAMAYSIARAAGVDAQTIGRAIQSFPGLAHRQQLVDMVEGIPFVNDSKATNADAAAKALICYDNIHWIAGGRAKSSGLTGLEALMQNVRRAYLIGEAASDFAAWLEGRCPVEVTGTLDRAVDKAFREARKDLAQGRHPIVLLSPACASFDQFRNFEMRGERFQALVHELAGGRREGRA